MYGFDMRLRDHSTAEAAGAGREQLDSLRDLIVLAADAADPETITAENMLAVLRALNAALEIVEAMYTRKITPADPAPRPSRRRSATLGKNRVQTMIRVATEEGLGVTGVIFDPDGTITIRTDKEPPAVKAGNSWGI